MSQDLTEGVDENDLGGEDDEEEDITHQHNSCTFEVLAEDIDLIVEFAKGLKHQLQLRDRQMLNALERERHS